MNTYHEVTIYPVAGTAGEYQASTIESEGWTSLEDLIAGIESALGAGLSASYITVHDAPDYVYQYSDANGETRYIGIEQITERR